MMERVLESGKIRQMEVWNGKDLFHLKPIIAFIDSELYKKFFCSLIKILFLGNA